MKIGSLFSGAGGLDLAVERVFGGRTVWHCEVDSAASKVLAYRWPGVPNLGDITEINWNALRFHIDDVPGVSLKVDVLCGGFPCQDVSTAGRRAGIQQGTRSGLWAMFADAIAGLRPRYVVIENVRGLLSADGEPWPAEVQAAAVEVAHLDRVVRLINRKINKAIRNGWWHGDHKRRKQSESARMARRRDRALARFRSLKRRLVQRAIGTVVRDLADLGYDAQWTTVSAASVGAPHRRERVFILATDTTRQSGSFRHRDDVCAGGGPGRHEQAAGRGRDEAGHASATVDLLPTPRASDAGPRGGTTGFGLRNWTRDYIAEHPDLLPTPRRSDGDGGPNPLSRAERMDDVETRVIRCGGQWGKYEPAIRRWESLTRPAPSPTEPNTKGNPRLAPVFPEWMQGWPGGWVTAVPGISRNDQLRIIGNGVCPQQAMAALWQLIPISQAVA